MSLVHRSTSSSPALMPPLDDQESTVRKNMEMLESSICTAHTDFNYNDKNKRAWAELLDREGNEDENDGIHPKMKQK